MCVVSKAGARYDSVVGCRSGADGRQIYTVIPDPVTRELPNFASDDASFVNAPTSILQQLPRLLYVPERWSATSIEEWKANDPVWRAHRICSRRGWVPATVPVLPFHLEYSEKPSQKPTFSAFTIAPVTVVINPSAYVIRTPDVRDKCSLRPELGINRVPFDAAMVGKRNVHWDDFQDWRCADGANGVLQELDGYWRGLKGGKPVIMEMRELEDWVKWAGRKAAEGREEADV